MLRVPYVDFPAQFAEEREELMLLLEGVFSRGDFVGGAAIEALEQALSAYLGAAHVVALNSGTDALILGLRALDIGPGDEVITPPNSFVASTAAIVAVGATPVFADVREDQNIDPAAIAADIGCFSAHPLKNLNAAGDAGFLVTGDAALAARVRLARSHGMQDRNTVASWGTVSRLDTLQAEILRLRLRHLPSVLERRRRNAASYERLLPSAAFRPPPMPGAESSFHLFVIQVEVRDRLKAYLLEQGIETAIHYPVPIHLQPAAQALGHAKGSFPRCEAQAERILSLPIHQFLSSFQVEHVAAQIAGFLGA